MIFEIFKLKLKFNLKTMKTITVSILLLLWVTSDPFAPKAERPQNPNNNADISLAITFLENVTIPEKESVGFPAYPDARIFQTSKPGELGSPLNMVRTFSEAQVDEVVDFYKQNMPDDWENKDFFGINFFWSGDENQAMMAQIPSIQISNADDFKSIWPNANTIITIYYE
jgi:hypothetical protein